MKTSFEGNSLGNEGYRLDKVGVLGKYQFYQFDLSIYQFDKSNIFFVLGKF